MYKPDEFDELDGLSAEAVREYWERRGYARGWRDRGEADANLCEGETRNNGDDGMTRIAGRLCSGMDRRLHGHWLSPSVRSADPRQRRRTPHE